MKLNVWKVSTVVFGSALAFTLMTAQLPSAEAEAQPRMRTALTHLKSAKAALQKASHDKGGHRVKALALTNSAIAQVQKGIAYDNKHKKDNKKKPTKPKH